MSKRKSERQLQRFLDWCNANPQSTSQEWVKNFKRMGWTAMSDFGFWTGKNEDHQASKKFGFVLDNPSEEFPKDL